MTFQNKIFQKKSVAKPSIKSRIKLLIQSAFSLCLINKRICAAFILNIMVAAPVFANNADFNLIGRKNASLKTEGMSVPISATLVDLPNQHQTQAQSIHLNIQPLKPTQLDENSIESGIESTEEVIKIVEKSSEIEPIKKTTPIELTKPSHQFDNSSNKKLTTQQLKKQQAAFEKAKHIEQAEQAEQNKQALKLQIKQQILGWAKTYQGQGDADFSKQQKLNQLVAQLLKIEPQKPIKQRLNLLYGPWQQIWGPYDYRNDERGVDSDISPKEIYQVVFEGGYYYNVNPSTKDSKIGLLRGEYKIINPQEDYLSVRFTDFPANKNRPQNINLWDLPELAEKGELPEKTKILPSTFVRLFFGGGVLREVYTDENMRITYGAKSQKPKDRAKEYIYIMIRP